MQNWFLPTESLSFSIFQSCRLSEKRHEKSWKNAAKKKVSTKTKNDKEKSTTIKCLRLCQSPRSPPPLFRSLACCLALMNLLFKWTSSPIEIVACKRAHIGFFWVSVLWVYVCVSHNRFSVCIIETICSDSFAKHMKFSSFTVIAEIREMFQWVITKTLSRRHRNQFSLEKQLNWFAIKTDKHTCISHTRIMKWNKKWTNFFCRRRCCCCCRCCIQVIWFRFAVVLQLFVSYSFGYCSWAYLCRCLVRANKILCMSCLLLQLHNNNGR